MSLEELAKYQAAIKRNDSNMTGKEVKVGGTDIGVSNFGKTCENCGKTGHLIAMCYSAGAATSQEGTRTPCDAAENVPDTAFDGTSVTQFTLQPDCMVITDSSGVALKGSEEELATSYLFVEGNAVSRIEQSVSFVGNAESVGGNEPVAKKASGSTSPNFLLPRSLTPIRSRIRFLLVTLSLSCS